MKFEIKEVAKYYTDCFKCNAEITDIAECDLIDSKKESIHCPNCDEFLFVSKSNIEKN